MKTLHPRANHRTSAWIVALLSFVVIACILPLATGCGGGGRPPKELAPGEIPAAVESAFLNAGQEARQQAGELVAAVEAGDDSRAYIQLQALLNRSDLTTEQRDVVSRSMMSLGARLNEAAEAGDDSATRVMETHGAYK
jgi:hypothetical protein